MPDLEQLKIMADAIGTETSVDILLAVHKFKEASQTQLNEYLKKEINSILSKLRYAGALDVEKKGQALVHQISDQLKRELHLILKNIDELNLMKHTGRSGDRKEQLQRLAVLLEDGEVEEG